MLTRNKTEELLYLDMFGCCTDEQIENDSYSGYLTENTGADGKDYLWYYDGNLNEAIRIEDNTIIRDAAKLDQLFC